MVQLEICVDCVESALGAQAGGATRVELCDGLVDGGVTPSIGKVAAVVDALSIPVHVLVRPRGGDFCYSPAEVGVMVRDVEALRGAGADGIVIGALAPDGTVDEAVMEKLLAVKGGMRVTFHRAVDVCSDAVAATRVCGRLGCDFILTSGQAPTAVEGSACIRDMVAAAAAFPGLHVMAGGGVRAHNVGRLVARTGVQAVHTTARVAKPSAMTFRRQPTVYMGGEKTNTPEGEFVIKVATVDSVKAVLAALPPSPTP